MAKIVFEDRAVAFLDILGFKSVVSQAAAGGSSLRILEELVTLLESAVPTLNKQVDPTVHPSLIPEFIYISDCIILSAPITSVQMPAYNGLNAVVMRAIQLSHAILDKGYILSGGISVGKVWHTTSNIVGPAYVEAYKLQESLAPPCIQLSVAAAKMWSGTPNSASEMCISLRNKEVVNITHDYYIPNNHVHGTGAARIARYKAIASANVGLVPNRARRKWQWHLAFLDRYAS